MNSHIARIVSALSGDGPQVTRGTRVMVGDVALDHVTGLTLRADVNDVWRATIECIVAPPAELLAAAVFEVRPPETFWSRFLRWVNGEPRDVTHLSSTEMEWER